MRFTLSWLKHFLETDATLETIANSLTMIGLEVESIEDKSQSLANFEVAYITSTEKHPQADKLQICHVQTADKVLQIVCGGHNARAGIKVALAKIGAVIPNSDFKIKESTIRGIASMGMLCSAEELGLNEKSDGIIELDSDAQIGDNIASYIGANDPVIDINITPNRADALGVYGIARDLAAYGIGVLKKLDIPIIKENFDTNYQLTVGDSDACPFFSIREIKSLNNIPSPKWLQDLLKNIGIGSISPVVDVTNYISYSFGQPMHAYDADKIANGLSIEKLSNNDKINALNDKEYELQNGDLVIKDTNSIQCIAGIIGSADSACSLSTKNIILEAAVFCPKSITKTGRDLRIDTDSRYRFERNVDREFTLKALDIATNMIMEICGGEASKTLSTGINKLPIRKIDFPLYFLHSRTNMMLDSCQVTHILKKLGFICEDNTQSINITIPSWRYDVSIKEDIVEEIVRIHGYNNIPQDILPEMEIARIIPVGHKRISDFKRQCAIKGYTEVVTWSFMDSKKAELFTSLKDELILQNPISSDLDYMRPSILPNLLQICCNNLNRSFQNLSFFELGPIFKDTSDNVINNLCGVRVGRIAEKNSHKEDRQFDVFDIKADIAAILESAKLDLNKCQIINNAPDYFHPTRSATISLGKNIIGYFGQVHPLILKKYEIDVDVMAFELNINNIPYSSEKFGKRPEYAISNYQMVTRDYAFIIDIDVPAMDLLNLVKNTDKKLIKSVNLFDIYSGDKIEQGKKSIALSVNIQDQDRTLTDADIAIINQKIIAGMKQKFSAILRDC
ncbi:MAG: phenylalanine--tRNA ligase subunit beta [Rickettsiales bacterium]|nr:MAG: phenylalanine--tRNA ligase subunit beta [Rickettsiales bacterium]